ncbi:hypothetical protein [Roseospira marina]|nr:hypothetical protein [Roseospira marina]MBB4316068.1 hypothetical protein [Roseospira marina]MBB5089214.1 hypothetical protein [Roseospira marina]
MRRASAPVPVQAPWDGSDRTRGPVGGVPDDEDAAEEAEDAERVMGTVGT